MVIVYWFWLKSKIAKNYNQVHELLVLSLKRCRLHRNAGSYNGPPQQLVLSAASSATYWLFYTHVMKVFYKVSCSSQKQILKLLICSNTYSDFHRVAAKFLSVEHLFRPNLAGEWVKVKTVLSRSEEIHKIRVSASVCIPGAHRAW